MWRTRVTASVTFALALYGAFYGYGDGGVAAQTIGVPTAGLEVQSTIVFQEENPDFGQLKEPELYM